MAKKKIKSISIKELDIKFKKTKKPIVVKNGKLKGFLGKGK